MNKVLAIACLGILASFSACKRESKDEKFKRDFELFTQKDCPKLMDPCTRMDSVCYDIGSRTMTEYYTVMGELDDDSIYADEKVMGTYRETLQNGLKSSIQLKPYKDEGISFRYVYRSLSTGETRLELIYTPEDYQ